MSLDLSSTRIGTSAGMSIATSENLKTLIHLNLQGNYLQYAYEVIHAVQKGLINLKHVKY